MNEALWLGVVVALLTSTVGPMALTWLTARQARRARIEDLDRQDLVAARAAEAVRVAKLSQETMAAATSQTNDKLDVIHALVNSNLTLALQGELDATVRELALMRELVSLHRFHGSEPSAEAMESMAHTAARITALQSQVNERISATWAADLLAKTKQQ